MLPGAGWQVMLNVISDRLLSDLVGRIYDCALDPSRWEPTLAAVAAVFDCAVASLTLNDVRRNRFLLNKASGWDPELFRCKSEKHVPEINAVLTDWLSSRPSLDEPFVTSLHLRPGYVERSPYVRECLQPQGLVDVMHLFLRYTPWQFSEIGLGRHARQGVITEREVTLAKLLMPHLRRAVTISEVLDTRAIERTRMAETLDTLQAGVLLTNDHGAILHANRSASEMLRRGAPIRAVQGVLEAQADSATRELRNAIRLAMRKDAGFGKVRLAIRLTEPDQQPAYAHVLPLSAGELRTRLQPSAAAAVFIGKPQEPNGVELLATTFDLTVAETRVLECLLAGRSLAEAAAHLGIAVSTARTHLKHIFEKAGVSRQTELIRLAMQLSFPLRPTSA